MRQDKETFISSSQKFKKPSFVFRIYFDSVPVVYPRLISALAFIELPVVKITFRDQSDQNLRVDDQSDPHENFACN